MAWLIVLGALYVAYLIYAIVSGTVHIWTWRFSRTIERSESPIIFWFLWSLLALVPVFFSLRMLHVID